MCEVEIDSNIVEVVDNEAFSDMGVVAYDHYEVRVGDEDQYEEVTCENDDSQGLLLQNIDDGNASIFHNNFHFIEEILTKSIILSIRIRRSDSAFRIGFTCT